MMNNIVKTLQCYQIFESVKKNCIYINDMYLCIILCV